MLEGSIRRVGDEMRINAQLIDGSTSGHLWAERFDGRWADVFALQDKVVGSIAGALELRLVSSAQADRAGGTDNPAAYDAYLKGMDIYDRQQHAPGVCASSDALAARRATRSEFRRGLCPARLGLLERGHHSRRGHGAFDRRGLCKVHETLEAASGIPRRAIISSSPS